jgi:hypothetical protein
VRLRRSDREKARDLRRDAQILQQFTANKQNRVVQGRSRGGAVVRLHAVGTGHRQVHGKRGVRCTTAHACCVWWSPRESVRGVLISVNSDLQTRAKELGGV